MDTFVARENIDKFIARDNIRFLYDRLETESNPSARSLLQQLLIEEADKLGRNSSTLCEVETYIADGTTRVNRQQVLVASIERDGRDTTHAVALLDRLSETLLVLEDYRQAIMIALT